MKLRLLTLFYLFILSLTMVISSNTFSRETSGNGALVKYPIGTRANALGGAFVALSDDASAFYHNPAGIAMIEWAYLSFNGQRIPTDTYNSTLGFISPPGDKGKWAFGLAGNFTTNLGIKEVSSSGQLGGSAKNYGGVGYLTLARVFGKKDDFAIGVNLKGINEMLDNNNSYGGGLDFGMKMGISFLNVGVMLQDLFTMEQFSHRDQTIYYDRILKMGVASRLSEVWSFSIQIDKNMNTTDNVIFRIGGYFNLWKGKDDLDKSLENYKKFERNISKALTPKKEFPKAFYLNIGYGNGETGFGFTLQTWGMKFDIATLFKELYIDKMKVFATVDIPLY